MTESGFWKLGCAIWLGAFLANLLLWGTIGYVVYHFVQKYW